MDTRAFLSSLGLPEGDRGKLAPSGGKFASGADFGIEIPTVNTVEALRSLLRESDALGVTVNRVDETLGGGRHTESELREYVRVCRDRAVALNISIGPRATTDLSATRLTEQGKYLGYRLRGTEQLVHALDDAKRSCDCGARGLIVYDEGLLWVLNEARRVGELPKDVRFKLSAHCGYGNAASLRLAEKLGADSVNPVRDLPLSMLGGLRAALAVPLDIHIDCPAASGGFHREYEAGEIVRVCAPVFLKTGNSVLSAHGALTGENEAVRMARQAALTLEYVHRYAPEAKQLLPGEAQPQCG